MVLYLISVGLSMTMGLMGFVNLAHGAFAMGGGYLALTLMNRLGVNFFLAVAVAVIVVGFVGMVLERLLYAGSTAPATSTRCCSPSASSSCRWRRRRFVWGAVAQPVVLPEYLRGQIEIMGRAFPTYRSFLIVIGAVIVTALWLGIERTRFGAQIRAAVDNRRMAESIGIDTAMLFTGTFAVGSALAALGGALGADILAIDPTYTQAHLINILIVVVVGGLGSIRGPFYAALLLGISDTACKYLIPEFGSFYIYAATLAVLLWRPRGLFAARA